MSRDRAIRLIREAAELDQDDAGDVYPTEGAAAAIARIQRLAAEHDDRPVTAAIAEVGIVEAVRLYESQRNPKRMGRPPRAGAPTSSITVRVTEDERGAWTEMAGDQPLADWIRERCNAARRR